MKQQTRKAFKLRQTTLAVMMATAGLGAAQLAYAGPGAVPTGADGGYTQVDPNVTPNNGLGLWVSSATRPTYYANSPLGSHIVYDPATGNPVASNSGKALRKFVDGLPGLTAAGANDLGQYLPVAVADPASYPGADYYEMAVVEYTEQVHSDLPKATTFRGYVQIDRAITNSSSAAGLAMAKKYSELIAALPGLQQIYTQALNYNAQFASYSALLTALPAVQTAYSTAAANYQQWSTLNSGLNTAQLQYNAALSAANAGVPAMNAALAGVQADFTTASKTDAAYQALVDGLDPAKGALAQAAYDAAMAPITAYQTAVANLPVVQAQYTLDLQPQLDYLNRVATLASEQVEYTSALAVYKEDVVYYTNVCNSIMAISNSYTPPLNLQCPPAPIRPTPAYGYVDSTGTGTLSVQLPSDLIPGYVVPAVPSGYAIEHDAATNKDNYGVLTVATVPNLKVPTVPAGYVVDTNGILSVYLGAYDNTVAGGAAPGTAVVPTGFTNTGGSLSVSVTPVAPPAGYVVDPGTGMLIVDLQQFTPPGAAPTAPTVLAGYVYVDFATGTLGVDPKLNPIVPVGYSASNGILSPIAQIPTGYVDVAGNGILSVDPALVPSPPASASAGSRGVPLTYPDGTAILVPKEAGLVGASTVWDHSLVMDPVTGQPILVPAYAYDKPHYLGPVIVAKGESVPDLADNKPVRMKFDNLLPIGRATCGITSTAATNACPAGQIVRHGDLEIPFDTTLIGGGPGPTGEMYMQNRAAVHLHGGVTPWISDGTPHQWITPVGETSASVPMRKGASLQNVPDMPDPGEGAETLYWTNAQSARLMFWHDHTVAQTRLNVYAGMAAGYLIDDASADAFATAAGIDPVGIPLVFEDKTFVPADIAQQDSKWRTDAWGQPGDLWFPHVVETNQDPNSKAASYTNPVGRWDYALWFWPVFPVTNALPTGDYGDVTTTPENYNDTPTLNGTAYPTLTVSPGPVRFRVLNAANDRFVNMQLYVADPSVTTSDGRINTEVKMIDAIAASGLPDCQVDSYDQLAIPLIPVTPPPTGSSLPASGPGSCYPVNWPTDGRVGGVPDPSMVGPTIWHIGSEGGLLPGVAAEPPVPVNYDYNRRSVTVLNVSQNNDPTQACGAANGGAGACHGLYLGPAERADVVVDFSAFAGKTLIMYNDAPAPNPGTDPRIDYYTGDPDNTLNGAAPTTLAGFGPNTRTIMQIVVAAGTPVNATPLAQAAFVTTMNSALKTAYAASQSKPIVAEAAYDAAFGTTVAPAGDQSGQIAFGSTSQLSGTFIDGNGNLQNYCVPNVVAATGTTFPDNMATLQMPASGVNGTGAGITCTGPILNKTIQELFDKYGRMNATLGTELPATSATTQTTLPFGYIDPNTETLPQGETQIWKITHNGVDAHPVHFHLLNVQLINRVGWDGTLKAPETGELGWKETIKMNPLEDVNVAVRAKIPPLPGFGLPKSLRPMDPSQPIGGSLDFMNIDPYTGVAPAGGVTNQIQDFDWEYVWHCHILGHEENDFMRPFVYTGLSAQPTSATQADTAAASLADNALVNAGQPAVNVAALPSGAPSGLAIAGSTFTWTDNSTNEYRFDIQKAAMPVSTTVGGQTVWTQSAGATFATIGSSLANRVSWTSPTAPASGAYQVLAVAAGGTAASNVVLQNVPAPGAIAPPTITGLTTTQATLHWVNPTPGAAAGVPTSTQVTACQTANPAICATPYTVNYAQTPVVGAYVAGNASHTFTGLTPMTAYTFKVTEVGIGGQTSSTVNATTLAPLPAVPAGLTFQGGSVTATGLALNWNAVQYAATYTVQRATNAGFSQNVVTSIGIAATSLTVTGLTPNTRYYFRVQAVNGAGNSGYSGSLNTYTLPNAPTNVLAANGTGGGTITAGLTWTGGGASAYQVQYANNLAMTGATTTTATSGAQINVGGAARTVYMQVRAVGAAGATSAWMPATAVTVSAQ